MVRNRQNQDHGFVLLVVIVVMLLISFLASQLILQVRTELKIATNRSDHIKERMLAEGGINLGLFRLHDEIDVETEEILGGPFKYGKTYEYVFPEGKIEYYVVNESGKISLNASDFEPLMLFLEYYGLDEDEREVVRDSLLDWRDNDNLYRVNGAEEDYYTALERPYLPRNGRIVDPGEFFLIRGTERLRGKFDPYEVFTVYNQTSKIDFNSLTPAMLDFLTGGDQEKEAIYWELREDVIHLSAGNVLEVLGSERYPLFSKHLAYNLRNNPYYTIVATGVIQNNVADDDGAESNSDGDGPVDHSEKKKKGVTVKTLVNSRGNKLNYLSWRLEYL